MITCQSYVLRVPSKTRNLMHMLHHSNEDLKNLFWELATTSLPSLQLALNESFIPASVIHADKVIDSIEKCMWILRKKFNYSTTTKIKVSQFSSLKWAFSVLSTMKFPMVISVNSRQATYNHVVVVWQNKVIDFESRHTSIIRRFIWGRYVVIIHLFVRSSEGMDCFRQRKYAKWMKIQT